jgi:hypothetical protein
MTFAGLICAIIADGAINIIHDSNKVPILSNNHPSQGNAIGT